MVKIRSNSILKLLANGVYIVCITESEEQSSVSISLIRRPRISINLWNLSFLQSLGRDFG